MSGKAITLLVALVHRMDKKYYVSRLGKDWMRINAALWESGRKTKIWTR